MARPIAARPKGKRGKARNPRAWQRCAALIRRPRAREVAGKRRSGFSLIELLAVLVIVAIIAGAAAYAVRLPIGAARAELAVQQFLLLDRQLRQHAQRFRRPAELTLDLDRPVLLWSDRAGQGGAATVHRLEGIGLDRFASATRSAERGQVTIAYLANGETPSYAVRFRRGGGPPAWLLLAGLTGQAVRVDDEREINGIFRFLSARADAD